MGKTILITWGLFGHWRGVCKFVRGERMECRRHYARSGEIASI